MILKCRLLAMSAHPDIAVILAHGHKSKNIMQKISKKTVISLNTAGQTN
jgi:hypothetical protein